IERIARRYRTRSAWARVARTAGPLLALRIRNWIPAISVARAMALPSASTSLTKCPLPIPPIDGLQDIWPRVSMLWVRSSVRRPARAAASVASVPAWPPPTTITSKRSGNSMFLKDNLNQRELVMIIQSSILGKRPPTQFVPRETYKSQVHNRAVSRGTGIDGRSLSTRSGRGACRSSNGELDRALSNVRTAVREAGKQIFRGRDAGGARRDTYARQRRRHAPGQG